MMSGSVRPTSSSQEMPLWFYVLDYIPVVSTVNAAVKGVVLCAGCGEASPGSGSSRTYAELTRLQMASDSSLGAYRLLLAGVPGVNLMLIATDSRCCRASRVLDESAAAPLVPSPEYPDGTVEKVALHRGVKEVIQESRVLLDRHAPQPSSDEMEAFLAACSDPTAVLTPFLESTSSENMKKACRQNLEFCRSCLYHMIHNLAGLPIELSTLDPALRRSIAALHERVFSALSRVCELSSEKRRDLKALRSDLPLVQRCLEEGRLPSHEEKRGSQTFLEEGEAAFTPMVRIIHDPQKRADHLRQLTAMVEISAQAERALEEILAEQGDILLRAQALNKAYHSYLDGPEMGAARSVTPLSVGSKKKEV